MKYDQTCFMSNQNPVIFWLMLIIFMLNFSICCSSRCWRTAWPWRFRSWTPWTCWAPRRQTLCSQRPPGSSSRRLCCPRRWCCRRLCRPFRWCSCLCWRGTRGLCWWCCFRQWWSCSWYAAKLYSWSPRRRLPHLFWGPRNCLCLWWPSRWR